MQSSQNDLQELPVNNLIDLLLAKASELLKITDPSNQEEVSRLTSEMEEIHKLIKTKRNEG